MKKITSQLITESLMPLILKLYYYDELICPNCLRKVPNKTWFIKKRQCCIWCNEKQYKK
jgi:hypothetical protein